MALTLTRKGRAVTRRLAVELLRHHLYVAVRLGVAKVWTHAKRRNDEVIELTIRRIR